MFPNQPSRQNGPAPYPNYPSNPQYGQPQQNPYQQPVRPVQPRMSNDGRPLPPQQPLSATSSVSSHEDPSMKGGYYPTQPPSQGFDQRSGSSNGFHPSTAPYQQPATFYPNPPPQQQQQQGYPMNNGDFHQRHPQGGPFGSQPQAPPNNQFQQPLFGQDMFQNPTAQLGLQLGSTALAQGQEIVNQNIGRYVNMHHLKYYFNVSNSYVLNKLRLLLFSFRHKQWTRLVNRSMQNGQMEGYKYPRDDINAPDLYIPVMAFVTYVLLKGILLGREEKFKPEVLGMTSTTGLFVVAAEVMFVKLGCYLLNVTTDVPFLDLFAYCGFKFVPIVATLIVKILRAGTTLTYTIFIFFMLSFGFYTLRTLKYIVLPEQGAAVVTHGRKRRMHFLLVIALLQILVSWFLV